MGPYWALCHLYVPMLCLAGLIKILFYDIASQLKVPAALASFDATNCYDRVAHAVSSIIFHALVHRYQPAGWYTQLTKICSFFLCMAFQDPAKSVGAKVYPKTHGYIQRNGAAPVGWAVVSISIIHAHKKDGHGTTFLCPITTLCQHAGGILFIDNTDIIHTNMESDKMADEAHLALQHNLNSWGQLLITSERALKPEKCFFLSHHPVGQRRAVAVLPEPSGGQGWSHCALTIWRDSTHKTYFDWWDQDYSQHGLFFIWQGRPGAFQSEG